MRNGTKKLLIFGFLVVVAVSFFAPSPHKVRASGASLYVVPATGSFAVGDTFTVSIYLNTGGQSVNAVEADLSFPADKLQVVSPTTGNSFVQIWVTQPSYSNSQGTLKFQGTMPSPGINTTAGLLSTIVFRVMDTGAATVKFLDGSRILANDGVGTDILSQTTDGIYNLTVPPPAGPTVTSPTNPDQSKWYNANSVVLDWLARKPAQGYSYVLDNSPATIPDNISEGTSDRTVYNNLSDGIYYFHIKSLVEGAWGGTTHFPIRVDVAPPAAFTLNISPGTRTTDQDPIVFFQTTDAVSGIDHYDIKFIPLDPPLAEVAQNNKPFFIEASSPYTQHLALGSYDVVVRAYNLAGDFYQATQQIDIVSPLFQVVGTDGLRIGGGVLVPWPYVIGVLLIILALLVYGIYKLWKLHRELEHRLERGAAGHPEIAQKLAELKKKQREYEEALKKLVVVLFCVGVSFGAVVSRPAQAATAAATAVTAPAAQGLALDPPIINLYPRTLTNDEVLYLGGWANVPSSTVVVYIEQAETGNTFSGATTVGADGNWFYSFPQLLDSGHYVVWAELASGNEMSPPSPRVDITVAPTAIAIGGIRLNYEELYLALAIIFLVVALVLAYVFLSALHRTRAMRMRLEALVHEAEDSLRRGFSVLRRDIEREFAYLQTMKGKRALSGEEMAREGKIKKDLADVDEYVGKEIWKIEEEEKKM